jgi:hypothetical protein
MKEKKNFITEDNKFDVNKFNLIFDEEKKARQIKQKEEDEKRLKALNNIVVQKKIKDLNLSETLQGIKNTWFDILDDLLAYNFNMSIFTKDDRLYFMGITFLIIGIVLFLWNYFYQDNTQTDSECKFRYM